MIIQEVWFKYGMGIQTCTNTRFTIPGNTDKSLWQISEDLKRRQIYVGLIAPGAVVDSWKVEFRFFYKSSQTGYISSLWTGAGIAGTGVAVDPTVFSPCLPFVVSPGGTAFDYPPLAAKNARNFQVRSPNGTCENLTMFPTEYAIEADSVEVSGQVSIESCTNASIYLVGGIVSEASVDAYNIEWLFNRMATFLDPRMPPPRP